MDLLAAQAIVGTALVGCHNTYKETEVRDCPFAKILFLYYAQTTTTGKNAGSGLGVNISLEQGLVFQAVHGKTGVATDPSSEGVQAVVGIMGPNAFQLVAGFFSLSKGQSRKALLGV